MKSYKTNNNTYLLILDQGDEVLNSITTWATENSIGGASITGIGALSEVTLGFYELKTKTYQQKKFTKEYELLSLIGNFSEVEGKTFTHIHAQLSDPNYQCIGGHLFSATVSVTAEIYIHLHGGTPIRKRNDSIGLNLITGVKTR